jgi:hypothetical protein
MNTLFSLFHYVKKGINDVSRLLNLPVLHSQAQNFALPSVIPARIQPPGIPASCRCFGWQQFAELPVGAIPGSP